MSRFTCIPNPYVLSIQLFVVTVVCQTSDKKQEQEKENISDLTAHGN